MKLIEFKSFKKMLMKSTDPKHGWKVALCLQDCHVSKIEHARALEDMAGLQLFIIYRKTEHTDGVIELDNLDEFSKAQAYAAYHSWPFTALKTLPDGKFRPCGPFRIS